MMRALVIAAALACASPAVAADAAALREAKEHYDRGMSHYNLGEYAAAVQEFKIAYARSSAPGLLFNAAQASRLGKDWEQALHFYRTYLRLVPEASNRADVEARIAEMEKMIEASKRPPPPVVAQPASPPVEQRPRVLPPGGKKERIAGIVVGVVGLAALGAGIGLGMTALDAQDRVSKLSTDMGSWTPDQQTLYRNGQHEAIAATALYAAGGAAVGAGVITYIVGWRKDRARFAVAPTVGGAQAVMSCVF